MGTFCWCVAFVAFYLLIGIGGGMFSILLPRLPHLVCRHLSYSDEICLWKVRLDWLIQFAGETIRSNSCCALVSSHNHGVCFSYPGQCKYYGGWPGLTGAAQSVTTAGARGPGGWHTQAWHGGRGQGPGASSDMDITSHVSPGEMETDNYHRNFLNKLIKTFIVTYPNFLFHCFLPVLALSTALKNILYQV